MTILRLRKYRRNAVLLANLESEFQGLIYDSKNNDGAGVKGGKSDVVSSIVIQREHLLAEIRYLQDEIQEVRKYISRCEPYFQNPIYQHYINGKTWISIAKNYNTTADSLRIACHRYVRQHPTFGEYAD